MSSSTDENPTYKSTGMCTSIQGLCIPTRWNQWANGETEIKVVVLLLCPFLTAKQPWDLGNLMLCFQFCHTSFAKLYFCPFLAVRFTLAYVCGCGYPDKPNMPKGTHLIHNSRCKSTWGVLGGWLGLQIITSLKYLRKCFSPCAVERRVCFSSTPAHRRS